MDPKLARANAGPIQTTLLELVSAVIRETDDEHEAVATVAHLLRTHRIRLVDNFRDGEIAEILESAKALSRVA